MPAKKKATVKTARQELADRRKQRDVVKLFGSIDYDSRYNYKRARRSRRGTA